MDEEAAAFPGHFLASLEERIRFVSSDVSFLLRSNFPIFIYFIIVRGDQRLSGEFSSEVRTRMRMPTRELVNPDHQGLLDGSVDQQSHSALEPRARSARFVA